MPYLNTRFNIIDVLLIFSKPDFCHSLVVMVIIRLPACPVAPVILAFVMGGH